MREGDTYVYTLGFLSSLLAGATQPRRARPLWALPVLQMTLPYIVLLVIVCTFVLLWADWEMRQP